MFSLVRHRLVLSCIAFAALTACSGGSSDPTTVAGDFTAFGVKGTVNGQNVTLDLSGLGNCATNIENMVIGINANGASISPDPRTPRDYSKPVEFTLTAPDGTKVVYTVTVKGAACIGEPPTPTPPAPTPPPSTPDTTPPVITVLGTNPLSLTVGTAYTEAGATCVDDKDATCTVVTTGTVNTATAGAYTITYTATDAAGNTSSKTRTINVTTAPVVPCTAAPISSTGYSLVFKGCSAANVAEYYDKTECVRQNSTGLIWQGQTAAGTGLRANDQYKTNYDSTTARQKWKGTYSGPGGTLSDTLDFVAPTAAEVNAATNSVGFKNAVNATNLCGSGAWRLPTKDELLGIVKTTEAPTIDNVWFPNTPLYSAYWTSSPYAGYAYYAWGVYFYDGYADYDDRGDGDGYDYYLVRLVR
jgi:Protein of unknown function (DUF1566)/Domain of unknown function (DUF5011)